MVTDSSSANLVFRSANGLYTPKDFLLPGTKRKYLLDCGKITEASIGINDIGSFDSVHFVNAMMDLEDNVKVETSSLLYLL